MQIGEATQLAKSVTKDVIISTNQIELRSDGSSDLVTNNDIAYVEHEKYSS